VGNWEGCAQVSLDTPPATQRGKRMSLGTAISTCLGKFATFRGRASRSEYWWFYLFCFLCMIAGYVVDLSVGTTIEDDKGEFAGGAFFWLSFLVLVVPQISAVVRRLHDTDRSGWWYWIALVPLVGIILLVWTCMRGTAGENRFGTDPLADTAAVFD
jgi:uncharacterized membrane protein YhaH (DUF805 family)